MKRWVGGPVDNCPEDANPDQVNVCVDSDEDGVRDVDDNCVGTRNPEQEDADEDGVGDACDNCPEDASDESDGDDDDEGDACEIADADGDGGQ